MTDDTTRAGVFVGVFLAVVVVGSVVAGPAIGGGSASAPDTTDLTPKSFTGDDVVATPAEESGELSMSADASGKVVVIDAGHGASIDREKLAPIVAELTENGATVKYFTGRRRGGRTLNATLREADAFITFGATRAYTETQLDGLKAFANAGGRVLVMNEPEKATSGIFGGYGYRDDSAPSPLLPVTSQFGMSYGNGYLYDMHEYSVNYRNVYATPEGSSTLTEGVDRLVFHEATPVVGGDTLVSTVDTSVLSQTRREGSYGVVARSGDVVVVGDTSVVSQEWVYRGDNEVFVSNLLDFLVSGDKSPENAPRPPEGGGRGPGGDYPAMAGPDA